MVDDHHSQTPLHCVLVGSFARSPGVHHHIFSGRGMCMVYNRCGAFALWVLYPENLLPGRGHVAIDSFDHRRGSRILARNEIFRQSRDASGITLTRYGRMIYIGTLRILSVPFILIACAAVAARLMKSNVASRSLWYALAGALTGYGLGPLLGALAGSVPHVMIEPRYFVETFMGCIAPSALLMAYMTSFFGILVGFLVGGFIGFRSSLPP